MREYKYKKVKQEALDRITCDRCGKTIKFVGKGKHFYEGIVLAMCAPYGSKHDNGPGDKNKWDVCDKCWDDILGDFINK